MNTPSTGSQKALSARGASPSARGFTLIEMLVVLALTTILLSLGVPGFSALSRNNKLVTQSNGLAALINGARMEAVARRRTVSICGTQDGNSCNGDWSASWIVFTDLNADGALDPADTVLLRSAGVPTSVEVDFSGAAAIRYSSLGYALPGSVGTFVFCDQRGDHFARALAISPTGRASVGSDTDATPDGIVNGVDGENISCE